MSAAVRRTCRAESKLEKGKIGRGRRVQIQKRRNKPPWTHEFESRRVRVRELKLHQQNAPCTHLRMQWTGTQSILLCGTATSPTGLSEGFFVGLKDSFAQHQLISCEMARQQRRKATGTCSVEEEKGHGMRPYGQGRCQKTPTSMLLAEVLSASPARGFLFLWNNVL